MKSLLMACLLLAGTAFIACEQATETENETTVETTTEVEETGPMLRHVVLFKFKDESSEAAVDSVITAFEALPEQISDIKGFEWGTNNSPEGLNDGFTHSFFLTFASEEGRDTYLPHPAHKAFGDIAGPHIDKVLVVDYWTEE